MRTVLILVCLLAITARPACAQVERVVRGVVLRDGRPAGGANVFVLETLDGALADSTGRFSFTTRAPNGASLVVQCLTCVELRTPLDTRDVWQLNVTGVTLLPGITVAASRFVTGNSPDAELTSLGVVQTPGAAADVYRALQTFPGVQPVNEGAGLFVRGGNVAETRVFVNDAVVLAPYKYESPTGGFFGAFDPFLLDGIHFSSGGFGAGYGDALSGVAALRTLGRPESAELGATASLASVSASGALPLHDRVGARATFTRSNTDLMFRLNGTDTEFTHVPEGRDASVIAEWTYGRGSSLHLFAIDQWSNIGVLLEDPSFDGALDASTTHRSGVLAWRHDARAVKWNVILGNAVSLQDVQFGALDIAVDEELEQFRARADMNATTWLRLSAGVDATRRTSSFRGRAPTDEHDQSPDAPVDIIAESIRGDLRGLFVESDWSYLDIVRVIAGARTDHSDLTHRRTYDPRMSLALRVGSHMTLTGAWGRYHQVPEPELFEAPFGDGRLRPMRAVHRVAGLQWERGDALVRAEAYAKRYSDLAALRRDRTVNASGTGTSRGIDLFVRIPDQHGIGGRVSYSFLRATRSDPDTRILATSPFDITHVVTAIADADFAQVYSISSALRYSTGRPVTAVLNAAFDAAANVWQPLYDTPFGGRLPDFYRVDFSFSRFVPLPHSRMIVLFAAVNNILDRKNVNAYRYNEDYSVRTAVRSQFNRSVYFGATVSF